MENCPVCNNKKVSKYWAMQGYLLSQCGDCGMVWDPNPPEDETHQYDKSYFKNDNPKGGYTNYFEGMRINKKTFYFRLKRIAEKAGKGSILDVGAALGDCIDEANKLGWKKAVGLEVSRFAVSEAKKKGFDVRQGTLATSSIKPNSFDVITYQDVIEHVKDPIKELKMAYKIISPDGYIFLVTPDIGGFWKSLLGPLWYHYKPREHIMYFSQKSLGIALGKAGFTNIETRKTYHVLSLEYILRRLKYYLPGFFEFLLQISLKMKISDLSFKAYTGEIEAWGNKK